MTLHYPKSLPRIAAIDWLRGLVMVLMALDHTSWFFNNQRIFADSILLYKTAGEFAVDQFFTRWITHICAPTFIFLAGTSIAINNWQRIQLAQNNAAINRDLLLRGAFIALLDVGLFSWIAGEIELQVLYAIGISMILMVLLQPQATRTVLLLAVIILAGSELLLSIAWQPAENAPLWLALTFAPVFGDTYSVLYPALPWLAMMMLGWVFGQRLLSAQATGWMPQRLLMMSGLAAIIVFIIIRTADGYGNMFMYLQGNSPVHWLYISKYPPSLAYVTLELGLMAILLSLLMRLEAAKNTINHNGPLLVFGQTALFFYLAHFCVLAVLRMVFERGNLEQTYGITLLVLVILYPLCRAYRTLKWRHPHSLLRFL